MLHSKTTPNLRLLEKYAVKKVEDIIIATIWRWNINQRKSYNLKIT